MTFHGCETCDAWLNSDYEHLHECLSVGDRVITDYELQTFRDDGLAWQMPKVPAGEKGSIVKIDRRDDGNSRAMVRFDRRPTAWVDCDYELSRLNALDRLADVR